MQAIYCAILSDVGSCQAQRQYGKHSSILPKNCHVITIVLTVFSKLLHLISASTLPWCSPHSALSHQLKRLLHQWMAVLTSTGWLLVWKTWKCRRIWQGNVRDFTKNQVIVRGKILAGKVA